RPSAYPTRSRARHQRRLPDPDGRVQPRARLAAAGLLAASIDVQLTRPSAYPTRSRARHQRRLPDPDGRVQPRARLAA
ncbi:hypothetical protein ED853_19335, partial [Acinetobacter baumannii]